MSTFKFIHAADLHLDSEFESMTPENAEKRRLGQRKILFRITDECVRSGAQALIISGDVFETDRPAPDTVRDLNRALGALAVPVFISPGNHDPYFSGSVWERIALPENVHVFKGGSFECVEPPGLNARFWGAGFKRAFCEPLLRGFSAPEKKGGIFDIMALHGDLGSSDYGPISREDIEKCGMDYLALGHIHMRSEPELAGKTTFCYSGCPEGRGFDETGEKGLYIVTLTESGAKAQFVPLGGVRYELLNIDISGKDARDAVLQCTSDLTEKDCLRAVLIGETDEPVDLPALRKALEGRFAEFQLRDETEISRSLWEQAGSDSLAGLFLQKLLDLLGSAASEDEKKRIELAAKYGLAALEGKDRSLL